MPKGDLVVDALEAEASIGECEALVLVVGEVERP